ncbi:MAG TPA: hypothetical protein VNP04_22885 [Alphaproteobacteria bacterium]|nr:hypothetical protein [Alphaproteobacteria bacterium]
MKGAALAVLMLLWSTSLAGADHLSQVYERLTLEYWGQRYVRSTTKILDEVIWPALFAEERARLGRKKPILEFPYFGEGETRHQPLAFYVPANRANIVFPIFSLKFLDDLCTAYAWLQVKGYGVETVSEYTAILKYGTPPAGGFPPPLKALGIPEHALNDPKVHELALGHFVTARTFLLLHEMGHVMQNRQGRQARTYAESVRHEQEADAFAATVMRRTPLPPIGILIFFMADAHWSGFPASGRDTHPLSGARVRALADHLDNPRLAKQLRDLGQLIDDPEIRAGLVATGKAGDLTALAPRRPGELPRRQVGARPSSQEVLFDGEYHGQFVQFLDPRPMAIEFVLQRQGDGVTGSYSFGLGIGAIDGKVVGNKLHFRWEWANNEGRGILEGRDDGSVAGTWGYHRAESGAGTWSGQRHP